MLLMIDYHLKYGSRDPVSNRPTFKIHLLIINHSDSDIFAAKIVEDIEKACEGALTVNYMISTPSQQYLPKPGIIIGKLSQEVIVSTMPRLPVDNKSPTRTPSVIPTQRQGVGHPSVLTHRKSFTFSPNLSDKGIIEAGENGSIDAEIPALSTKNPSSPAYRSNTRDDAAIRFNIRESGGATGMPMLMREDSSYKRRSYEDNNRMTQARSRTFSIQQSVLGNDVGLPSPAAQEVDLDLDMCRNMAMMVCGPTMMNNAVSDLLQDMGYPADMIYTM
ncbi:hypothetical protein BC829DRAFT_233659 [Chytridium lagenaria]|nr:hypothetical protein BC829DRAFT_233659 [Chytridium lagenaria]